jgi:hypothetical protein
MGRPHLTPGPGNHDLRPRAPRSAGSYDTITGGLEQQALAPRRERLLGGLTSDVVDV